MQVTVLWPCPEEELHCDICRRHMVLTPCAACMQSMYSERPQGRALTVRQAYSFGREDAEARAAAAVAGRRSWSAGGGSGPEAHDPRAGGDPGAWGRPPSAGVGSWCAVEQLLFSWGLMNAATLPVPQ